MTARCRTGGGGEGRMRRGEVVLIGIEQIFRYCSNDGNNVLIKSTF